LHCELDAVQLHPKRNVFLHAYFVCVSYVPWRNFYSEIYHYKYHKKHAHILLSPCTDFSELRNPIVPGRLMIGKTPSQGKIHSCHSSLRSERHAAKWTRD